MTRRFLLVATITLGLATIVKALQVALTPGAWAVLAHAADRLLASSGFGLLAALTGTAFLGSLSAAGWHKAERRYEREDEARARARAELLRRMAKDPSSFMAESPKGPLPETWRAPCGEIVHLHSNPSDRGPKAAA